MDTTIMSSTNTQTSDGRPAQDTRENDKPVESPGLVLTPPGTPNRNCKTEEAPNNPQEPTKGDLGETSDSPWDQIERKAIRIEDLNLDEAHDPLLGSTIEPPPVKKGPRHTRWQHTGREPITDVADLPEGWSMTEPDLDPQDINGQIKRCYERIEDRIMPQAFMYKLERLLKQKQQTDVIASGGPPGLQGRTLERWKTIDHIRRMCYQKGDKDNQLPNIHALLDAYTSKRLQWNGLVTYWWRGSQLCQPRRFDWDELEAIASHCRGEGGFWCEGITTPGPAPMKPSIMIPMTGWLFEYNVAYRLPGFPWWDELRVFHDTGCTSTGIYEEDVQQLMGPYRPPEYKVPVVGYAASNTFNGIKMDRMIELEVTILDGRGRRLNNWTRVLAFVMNGSYQCGVIGRPDGVFVYQSLYTATAPTEWPTLHIGTSKEALDLPKLNTSRLFIEPELIQRAASDADGGLDYIPDRSGWDGQPDDDFEIAAPNNRPVLPSCPKVMPKPAWPIVMPKPASLKGKKIERLPPQV